MPIFINKRYGKTNFTTFEKTLKWHEAQEDITEATEEAFWSYVESNGGINDYVLRIVGVVCWDEKAESINLYIITNQIDATSNEYIATENGTYTFTIQDIVTGKTYTKKVEVNNIGITADSMYKIVKENEDSDILLQSVDTNIATTFEKAYIRYNNEIIDITKTIQHSETYDHLSSENIGSRLVYLRKIDKESDIKNTNQLIIIIKDNKVYAEEINMGRWAE